MRNSNAFGSVALAALAVLTVATTVAAGNVALERHYPDGRRAEAMDRLINNTRRTIDMLPLYASFDIRTAKRDIDRVMRSSFSRSGDFERAQSDLARAYSRFLSEYGYKIQDFDRYNSEVLVEALVAQDTATSRVLR